MRTPSNIPCCCPACVQPFANSGGNGGGGGGGFGAGTAGNSFYGSSGGGSGRVGSYSQQAAPKKRPAGGGDQFKINQFFSAKTSSAGKK